MLKLIYPEFWHRRSIISYALLPFSKVYQLLGFIRRVIRTPIKLPAKVICIGNITVGGTGKTQVAICLAKVFNDRNIKFVIVSKGYCGNVTKPIIVNNTHTPEEVGDEALILSEYGTVISAHKVEQTIELIKFLDPEIVIVDDGMQNPGFHKDFTIITIDGMRGFGNNLLFPAGPLRQYPRHAFNDADSIIVIGDDNVLNNLARIPIFQAQIVPNANIDKSRQYFAFCGIGNPERFFYTLKQYGLQLTGEQVFPDHYAYRERDLEYLKNRAQELNSMLITTKKDYVKVHNLLNVDCFNVDLFIDHQQNLMKLIYEKILQKI